MWFMVRESCKQHEKYLWILTISARRRMKILTIFYSFLSLNYLSYSLAGKSLWVWNNMFYFKDKSLPHKPQAQSKIPQAQSKIPDVTNRTFGNRTQSNSNRSIDLDWVRQSNIIELTQTFCQSTTIERSKIEHFFNRTESNCRPIELCPWPALCHSKPVSFGFKQRVAVK